MSNVKSPRYLYRCTNLSQVKYVKLPDGTVEKEIEDALVLMKESHANWLGNTLAVKVPSSDPILRATRSVVRVNEATAVQTDAAEQIETYRRRVGGFRAKAFKLAAKGKFTLQYTDFNDDTGAPFQVTVYRKTISVGCPTGISLHRFMTWIETLPTTKLNLLAAVISPDGRRHQI